MKRRYWVAGALLGAWLLVLLAAGFTVATATTHSRSRSVAREISRPPSLERSGVVVSYVPGVAITVQSNQGLSTTFTLGSTLVIIPAAHAGELAVGKAVTIIALATVAGTPPAAIGVILHPLPGETGGDTLPPADSLAGIAG